MTQPYSKIFLPLWADMDPNGHMRHSAYNDYAAQLRLSYFNDHGLPMHEMIRLDIGPVLFREETRFFKEIRLNEEIIVDFSIAAARKDASKWTIVHQIIIKDRMTLAATITVEGAWLHLKQRKIVVPPVEIAQLLTDAPKTVGFTWIADKNHSA